MTSPHAHHIVGNPLDDLPMRAPQVQVLAIALLLAALDGFDILSMAFVAPSLALEWHVDKSAIGVLLSSSLVGMAVGAFSLSPVADIIGRKKVVLAALVLMTFGSTISAAANSVPVLAGGRLLTGIGIGVMIAMTTLISAEFANARRRSLAVAAVATLGTPLGSIIGGLGASAILKIATWRWVFLAGALCGVIMFFVAMIVLPESPAFIIARRSPNALGLVNRVLISIGQPAISGLPPKVDRQRGVYRPLFAPESRRVVLRLVAIALLVATSSYYILSWLPQIVVDAGFTPAQGSLVSAASGLVGLIGGVAFAAFSSLFTKTSVAAAAMTGAALALAAVGLVPAAIVFFVISAGAVGFCLAGTTGLLYAIAAESFPAARRAAGVGLVMATARLGSTAGPLLAGLMFKHGMTRAEVSLVFAIGPLVAALLVGTYRIGVPDGLSTQA